MGNQILQTLGREPQTKRELCLFVVSTLDKSRSSFGSGRRREGRHKEILRGLHHIKHGSSIGSFLATTGRGRNFDPGQVGAFPDCFDEGHLVVLHQVREAVSAGTTGKALVPPLSMSFVDAQRGLCVVVERTNTLVFTTLRFYAMIAPDEVGQGHGVADALDEVSIKQGQKVSLGETKMWRRCRLDRKRVGRAEQERHSPENCPCWAVRSFKVVEKGFRGVFRICQMYAAFRAGVVLLAKLLVFFLTNRG